MSQLTVVAKITAQPGKEQETKAALLALVPTTQQEAGFLQYDLHEAKDQAGVFLLYENWQSHAQWQQHMQNHHLQDFIARADGFLAKGIELSQWTLV
jgi:quinol monooxygenase YgiN